MFIRSTSENQITSQLDSTETGTRKYDESECCVDTAVGAS